MQERKNEIRDVLLSGCHMSEDLPDRICHLVQEQPTKTTAHRKRIFLIAALVALLVCGTAAGTWLWTKPDTYLSGIQISEFVEGYTLSLGEGYITLPTEAQQTILEHCDPERMYKSFLFFDTIEEWQSFCDIPLALSSRLSKDAQNQSQISMIVTHEETDDGLVPRLLYVDFPTLQDPEQHDYNLLIEANLSPDTANTHTFYYDAENATTEFLDYTTPSGIPCTLCKVKYEGEFGEDGEYGVSYTLELIYNCENITYTLQAEQLSEWEMTEYEESMKAIADTIEVLGS